MFQTIKPVVKIGLNRLRLNNIVLTRILSIITIRFECFIINDGIRVIVYSCEEKKIIFVILVCLTKLTCMSPL